MRRTSPEIGFWSMQTQCVAALLITPDGLRVRCSYAKRFGEILSRDRKSTRLNSSHGYTSYAVFCLKKKTTERLSDRQYNEATPMTAFFAELSVVPSPFIRGYKPHAAPHPHAKSPRIIGLPAWSQTK